MLSRVTVKEEGNLGIYHNPDIRYALPALLVTISQVVSMSYRHRFGEFWLGS